MSKHIDDADAAITEAIEKLVRKLTATFCAEEDRAELVTQIAKLRTSMNPVHIYQDQ